jgi:hypothetical protein
MQDSVREQVIQLLARRVEAIKVENGYEFDATIQRAVLDIDPTSFPVVVIWDGAEDSVQEDFQSSRQTMRVRVELMDDLGGDNPSIYGNKLLRDGRRAVEVYGDELTDLVESVRYAAGEIVYPDAGKTYIVASLTYEVTYSTAKGDPTSRPFI